MQSQSKLEIAVLNAFQQLTVPFLDPNQVPTIISSPNCALQSKQVIAISKKYSDPINPTLSHPSTLSQSNTSLMSEYLPDQDLSKQSLSGFNASELKDEVDYDNSGNIKQEQEQFEPQSLQFTIQKILPKKLYKTYNYKAEKEISEEKGNYSSEQIKIEHDKESENDDIDRKWVKNKRSGEDDGSASNSLYSEFYDEMKKQYTSERQMEQFYEEKEYTIDHSYTRMDDV